MIQAVSFSLGLADRPLNDGGVLTTSGKQEFIAVGEADSRHMTAVTGVAVSPSLKQTSRTSEISTHRRTTDDRYCMKTKVLLLGWSCDVDCDAGGGGGEVAVVVSGGGGGVGE